MTAPSDKVLFGLKNVHYSLWNTGQTPGWGTPVKIPGGVKLALTTTGSNTTFAADNQKDYVTFTTGSGYEGTIEIALLPDSVAAALLGMYVDSNGALVELANYTPTPFALLYEVEGDDNAGKRYVFYNCTIERPALNANTTGSGDSVTPDTVSVPITITSKEITMGASPSTVTRDVVKASMSKPESSAAAYTSWNNWFTSVYSATTAPA